MEQHDDLPVELWDRIFGNFCTNEDDDVETLLTCRLVSQFWEGLVDKLPPKLYWNPWLKDHHLNSLVDSAATTFTYSHDVTAFHDGVSSFEDEGRNPFTYNQTVRLCGIFGSSEEERKNLQKILNKYGPHIKKFIYFPISSVLTEQALLLPRLLERMTNLKTLIVDCSSNEKLKVISAKDFPKNLNLLELVINNDLYDVEDSVHAKLAINYGHQIKYLTMNRVFLNLHLHSKCVLDRFPALEYLKLNTVFFVKHRLAKNEWPVGNLWPKLKSLALGLAVEGSLGFRMGMRFITYFSSTLELLSLDVGEGGDAERCCLWPVYQNDDDNDEVQVITPFPKLSKLILPFSFVSKSQLSIEVRLGFDCPHVKCVVLQDMKEEFKNKNLNREEVSKICQPIWPLVPPSTETICLRTERWNQHILEHLPVVYKCPRNSTF